MNIRSIPLYGFAGRHAAGKDTIADKLNSHKLSVAEPFYAAGEIFFDYGKDARNHPNPEIAREIRAFWQRFGLYGKGYVDSKYPLTPERAMFCEWVRKKMAKKLMAEFETAFCVDWVDYGIDEDIWIYALSRRYQQECIHLTPCSPSSFSVTNIRYPNEMGVLASPPTFDNFYPVFVHCSESDLEKRRGPSHTESIDQDNTEALALEVTRLLQCVEGRSVPTPEPLEWLSENGYRFKDIVWNSSERKPEPSYLTVDEFCDKQNSHFLTKQQ